jgi:hypothetical protein
VEIISLVDIREKLSDIVDLCQNEAIITLMNEKEKETLKKVSSSVGVAIAYIDKYYSKEE